MVTFSIGGWSWPRRGEGSYHGDNFIREPIYLGLGSSRAGKKVDRGTALQTSAILCGARVISQGLAQVPLKVFRETDGTSRKTREPARDASIYRLLAEQPNDFQTSFSFRETLILHAVIGGDGYAFINRRRDGSVRELLPIAPDSIVPVWDDDKKELKYEFGSGSTRAVFGLDQILHVHGPSWSGYSGLPALELAREAIGLNVALRDSQADLFGKGARPSGILISEEALGAEASEKVKAEWQKRFGQNGEGGIALLPKGFSFTPMQMSAVDSQTIETMRFIIEEVARFMVIFPQMLMQADKPTYASVEQFFIAHVVHTLDPWMDRVEQELKKSVIGYAGENEALYPRFSREGLLRGASADRAEFYTKALGAGGSPAWMTQNEVRALENLNPVDEGDALPIPLNTQMQPPEAQNDD